MGIISQDWDVRSLGEVVSRLTNGAVYQQSVRGGVAITRIETIADGTVNFDRTGRAALTPELEPYRMQVGDVLYSHINSIEHIGKVALYNGERPLYHGMNLLLLRAEQVLDSRYLYYWLGSSRGRDAARTLARQAVSQASINTTDLKHVQIPFPPQTEQRAIGAALSDVDALLAGLDRLIAKKRDLKQAAMQQLLTGQTRLPGFQGEWDVKQLGDVAHIKTGSRNNEDKVPDGEYPFFVRSEYVERINTYSHDCEAILVPGEGRIGSIFHYIQGRFDVHQRVYAITQFQPEVSGRFVHLCMSFKFGAWAMQNTVKATVDSLRLPTFQTFEFSLPPTLDEQTAIAAALSDMEAEVAALETRRDKTRALKQGMMQELLTGRTRLV
jgi:type I restriction enzyme S subunit